MPPDGRVAPAPHDVAASGRWVEAVEHSDYYGSPQLEDREVARREHLTAVLGRCGLVPLECASLKWPHLEP